MKIYIDDFRYKLNRRYFVQNFFDTPIIDSIFPFGQDWRKQIITNKTFSNG
jgi:hypothetical protein